MTALAQGRPIGLVRGTQVAAVAGLGAYAAQATIAICGVAADGFFETWVYTGLLLVAAALCLARGATVVKERAAWLILGAGILAWAGGEVYWNVALSGLTEPPIPSGSDCLWLAFFPCCYVAIVLLVRARVREFRASLWLDGIVGALAIAAVGTALVFGALSAGGGALVDHRPRLPACRLRAARLRDRRLRAHRLAARPIWALLGAGLVISAVVDGFFLYQAATGLSVDTTLMATLWPASALLLGFAAWQPATVGRAGAVRGLQGRWRCPPLFAARRRSACSPATRSPRSTRSRSAFADRHARRRDRAHGAHLPREPAPARGHPARGAHRRAHRPRQPPPPDDRTSSAVAAGDRRTARAR